MKDHYRTMVGVDENIGRVLDYLDRKKLAQDTLVIYTTDNGFFLGEHGWYDKRFMYEPSLRLPLLVRYPRGAHAGRVESRFALNIDYAPTILGCCGRPCACHHARQEPASVAARARVREIGVRRCCTRTTRIPGRWPGRAGKR